MTAAEFGAGAANGLRNDLQAPRGGADRLQVGREGLRVETTDERLCERGVVADVDERLPVCSESI